MKAGCEFEYVRRQEIFEEMRSAFIFKWNNLHAFC